jgi:hypothetical protein
MTRLFAAVTAAILVIALAVFAGTAQAASSGPQAAAEDTAAGMLDVQFAVNKFVVRGKKLVAVGNVIGTFTSAEGTQVVRQPFASPVRKISKTSIRRPQSTQRAARICDILSLNLAPLRLELLGLIVELDRVVLTIKADSNGGLLGSLLCGLAGGSGLNALTTPKSAQKLTTVAKQSGLAAGPGFSIPVQAPTALPPVPPGVCTVLDLMLGPLDLNVLGLLVHLDRVHLRITADPTRGLLGSLLCSLAGGPPGLPAP